MYIEAMRTYVLAFTVIISIFWMCTGSTLLVHTSHPLFSPLIAEKVCLNLAIPHRTSNSLYLKLIQDFSPNQVISTFLYNVLEKFYFTLLPLNTIVLMLLSSTVSFPEWLSNLPFLCTYAVGKLVQSSNATFLDFYTTLVSPLFLDSYHRQTHNLSGTFNSHTQHLVPHLLSLPSIIRPHFIQT